LNETMSNLRNQFGVMGSSGQYDMKGLQDLVNSVNTAYSQRGATADQVKDAYMRGFTNLQKTPPVDIEMPRLRQVMPPAQRPGVGDPGSAYMETLPPRTPRTPLPPPPPTYPTYYDRIQPPVMPQPGMQPMVEPLPTPTMPEPYYPGNDVFRPTPTPVYDNFPPAIIDRPRDPMQPQNPPGIGGISSAIRDLLTKQPPTTGPMPPMKQPMMERQPRMPEKNVTMMKHGGRAAMSKGKR